MLNLPKFLLYIYKINPNGFLEWLWCSLSMCIKITMIVHSLYDKSMQINMEVCKTLQIFL